MTGDLLWKHLRELPAFRALLRAQEARFYQDWLPLEQPVLDVGCGDGHFAAVALTPQSGVLAAGVDPDARMLSEARARGAYRGVTQALGDRLPFAGGTFATVVSNSVLEHIPEVQPVLDEVSRVLRPGGKFLFCVPGDDFAHLLFFPGLFRRLGLPGLAARYEHYFNRISRHHHCDGREVWRLRLAEAGLEIDHSFTYFSRRAHHALDLGHYLGGPSLVAKKLFGRWILAPARWNLALTERWLRPLYEEPLPETGAYLFFVTHKPPWISIPPPADGDVP
ncbi:MAG: methyltransferase domain-containing protein [Anaerolineae bacterium]|nr:methyltransferase domain-containing protein [Anaerolineae bacterium]